MSASRKTLALALWKVQVSAVCQEVRGNFRLKAAFNCTWASKVFCKLNVAFDVPTKDHARGAIQSYQVCNGSDFRWGELSTSQSRPEYMQQSWVHVLAKVSCSLDHWEQCNECAWVGAARAHIYALMSKPLLLDCLSYRLRPASRRTKSATNNTDVWLKSLAAQKWINKWSKISSPTSLVNTLRAVLHMHVYTPQTVYQLWLLHQEPFKLTCQVYGVYQTSLQCFCPSQSESGS